MTKHRAIPGAACVATALLALAPSAASAQSGIGDVVMAGRAHGVEIPAEALAWMQAQGPDAFEFDNVWKRRVERVHANRAAFDAAQRQAPRRGAASTVTTAELQAAGAVLDGTFRMPVLLGLPNDRTAPHTAAAYQDRMFGAGSASVYSLTSFYAEMSQGVFDFTGNVIGWAPVGGTSAQYYGTDPEDIFGNTYGFLTATVASADPSVDFGQYDNDGPDGVPNSGDDDGAVDLTAFMFPAHGRECGGPGIWAHRWTTNGWTGQVIVTDDPSAEGGTIEIYDYIIQGGLDCDGASLQQVGLVAHEAGHGFGLPDLYDTQATTRARNGIGEWGLMGSGNWNRPESPAHMEAHSKAFLGWVNVVTITADTALTMAPILESATAYRVDVGGVPGEYFMLENRQRLGSDQFLNGTGLLIWHVDSVKYEAGRASNTVNAEPNHKGLDLEEADGLNHLDVSTDLSNYRGDAGDPWPGSSNRSTFDGTSSPSSTSYGAGASNIALTNIVETAANDITLFIDIPDMVTYGDVDGDDAVTVADLDVVTSWVLGATGPDYSRIGLADVDDDGETDARDAYVIHAYLNGVATAGFRVGELGVE